MTVSDLRLFAMFSATKLQLFADIAKYIFQFLASHSPFLLIFSEMASLSASLFEQTLAKIRDYCQTFAETTVCISCMVCRLILFILPENTSHKVNGIYLFIHHNISINLRGVDVGMTKHLTGRVDVAPSGQSHGGEGVAAGVE